MTPEIVGGDRAYLRGTRRPVRGRRGVLRVVDLFSGCGGLMLGVMEAARMHGLSLDVRLAVESDSEVAAVYSSNFALPGERSMGDVRSQFDRPLDHALSMRERRIRRLVGGDVGLLVGGPPCQGHSTLNNHTRGTDPKNSLYLAMVRATEVLEPAAIIVENVPAVERDSKRVVQRATMALVRLGYRVTSGVISVADLGVPQLRRRHVLVAHAQFEPNLFQVVATTVSKRRSVAWAIRDLRARPDSPFDAPANMTPDNLKRAAFLLRRGLYDLPNRMRPPCQRGDHRYKSMYGRLSWDEPAQTITTGFGSPGQGRYLHPDEPRTLTPHEAARLQFFPDWYDFGSLVQKRRAIARAIGNAVPPKLGFALAHHMLNTCLDRMEPSNQSETAERAAGQVRY